MLSRGLNLRRIFAKGVHVASISSSTRELKILIVDGYQQKSRDEFEAGNLEFASTLYMNMLREQAPKNVDIDFDIVFPCTTEYVPPTHEELSKYDGAAFTGSSLSAHLEDEPDVDSQVLRCIAEHTYNSTFLYIIFAIKTAIR
jgi:hypothetical protein